MEIIKIKSSGEINTYKIKNINNILINDIQLLYSWKYNNNKIEAYGSINDNKEIINIHKLPPNGTSKIIDEDSNTIDIYGEIYICKFDNGKLINLNISEYGEFFTYLTEYYEYDSQSDESSSYYSEEEYYSDEENKTINDKSNENYENHIKKICKNNVKKNNYDINELKTDNIDYNKLYSFI